jgi:hypothetical protein
MFTFLNWSIALVVASAMMYAYAASRDVFHPLMFLGPMLLFMYVWMPVKLDSFGGLDGFFQPDQLNHIQSINAAGVICMVLGCLSVGCRKRPPWLQLPPVSGTTLAIGGTVLGGLGFAAWAVTILNVGGLSEAFSTSYSGGWDDSGYIRDGTLLMFPGFLLILSAAFINGFNLLHLVLLPTFIAPWVITAALTARRGPTFMIVVILAMGWYMNRGKRPSLFLTATAGFLLGLLLLFLVTNRSSIYVGSDRELTTEVTDIVDKADTGNEYIYGAGGILSSEQRQSFYWGRRYLAQILVRPIPSSIWPTKYEDFGMPELLHNAGTGEGFKETLGWEGAVGSAPGLIADTWMEFWWLNLPVLFLLGRFYCTAWQKATVEGGPWVAQYIIIAALSLYLVMQTGEAVIFRSLLLSLPLRLTWYFARTEVPYVPVVTKREFKPENQVGRAPQTVL